MKQVIERLQYAVGNNSLFIRKMFGLFIGFLLIVFVAFLFGGVAAILPASFTAQLIFIVGGVVVFFAAILVPADSKVPMSLMRLLFFLLILNLVIWPDYISYYGLPGPGINPTRIIYWSLTAVWLFWFIVSRDLRNELFGRIALIKPFFIILVAYIVWGLICATLSETTFFSLYYFAKLMIGPLLVLLFALSCIRGRCELDFVIMFIVFATAITCVIAYFEVVKGKNLFYGFVPHLVRGSDIEALDFSDKVASIKNDAAGSNRLWSTFSNPLTFSEYLVLSFPLAVYLLGYASKRWQRILGFIASTASIAILLYSHARSGLIATALVVASLVVVFGFKAIRQKRSLGFSLIGAFAIIILIFAIIGSVGVFVDMVVGRNAAESGSSMARIVMLERGSILTMASPILGYGPGRAALTLGFLPGITQLTIDNYYLSVALETGFPGLLLFLGMLGYLIFKGAVVGATNSGIDSARVIVLVSALSGFATIRSVLSLTHNFGVLFLLIALLVIALEVEKNSASGE